MPELTFSDSVAECRDAFRRFSSLDEQIARLDAAMVNPAHTLSHAPAGNAYKSDLLLQAVAKKEELIELRDRALELYREARKSLLWELSAFDVVIADAFILREVERFAWREITDKLYCSERHAQRMVNMVWNHMQPERARPSA